MKLLVLEKEPIDHFSKSLARIALLLTISNDLEKYNTDRIKRKESILLKSYIVHLMATWQAYIEDLATYTFKELIVTQTHSAYIDVIKANFNSTINGFSSPNTKNIERLIKSCSGIENISINWIWNDIRADFAAQNLDKIWKIRCEIAHTASTRSSLTKDACLNYMKFLFNLGCITNNVLSKYTNSKTGKISLREKTLEYPELTFSQLQQP